MSEAAIAPTSGSASQRGHAAGTRAMFVRVAWRNLWRRRLRTWMSAGGLAFAIFLVSVFMALQAGTYGGWIDTATGLVVGHAQLQHPDYMDDPRFSNAIDNATELVRRLEAVPGVAGAAPRAEAFTLVSVGERSFGALVMGVDPQREANMFALPHRLREGEYLPRADSAYIGSSLAANLGVELGAEIVALGSSEEGGVAALVMTVDGIFETGQAELDRSVMQARLTAMQSAFEMGDSVHRVVVETDDAHRIDEFVPAITDETPSGARLLTWRELLPELEQAIQLDRVSALMMYWLLMIVVAMSVVNAFIMSVFERTREFGMLLAIGMKPNAVVGMLVIEAICVWVLGAAIGLALSLATVLPLSVVGIPIDAFEGVEEMAAQMMMPDSLYPVLTANVLAQSPLIMLAGTLLAALIPAMRVRRMKPVDALREEE